MTRNKAPPSAPIQASMFDTFAQADFERAAAGMPDTVETGAPYLMDIVTRYNAAILDGDQNAKNALMADAETLATRLNGGTRAGIKMRGSICDQLGARIAAEPGSVPLWGQPGAFDLSIRGCTIRIEYDGIYGLCELGFSADAVDWNAAFISETGYRSFLIGDIDCTDGAPPLDAVVRDIIEAHIVRDLKGALVPIEQRHRDRHNQPDEDPDEEEPQP